MRPEVQRLKRPVPPYGSDPADRLESALHDIANALAAARSFGEAINLRARAGKAHDPDLLDGMLREVDRAAEIVKRVRSETYRPGDLLHCEDCGHTFVHRKRTRVAPSCRRCKGLRVGRWVAQD